MSCEYCRGEKPLLADGCYPSDLMEIAIAGTCLKVHVTCDGYDAADELIPLRVCPMCGSWLSQGGAAEGE